MSDVRSRATSKRRKRHSDVTEVAAGSGTLFGPLAPSAVCGTFSCSISRPLRSTALFSVKSCKI